jgi:hypothetical protein
MHGIRLDIRWLERQPSSQNAQTLLLTGSSLAQWQPCPLWHLLTQGITSHQHATAKQHLLHIKPSHAAAYFFCAASLPSSSIIFFSSASN